MTENTAKFAGGTMIKQKFHDIISREQKHEEMKSGDEIVTDIVSRGGLELV